MPAVIIALVILFISVALLAVTVVNAVAAARRHEKSLDIVERDLPGRYRKSRKVYKDVHGRFPPGWNTEQFTALKGKRK